MRALDYLKTTLVNTFKDAADFLGFVPKTDTEARLAALRQVIRDLNQETRQNKMYIPIGISKRLPDNPEEAREVVKVVMTITQMDRYPNFRQLPFNINIASDAAFDEGLSKLKLAYRNEVTAEYARSSDLKNPDVKPS